MRILITILALTLSYCLSAQVSQVSKTMSLGNQVGFVQEHLGASEKHVETAWKDVMKKFGKPKMNRKSKNLESLGATIPTVSDKPLDIYMVINQGEGQTSSAVFVDNGMQFISSENAPEAAESLELFLTEFADATRRLVVQDELDAEEKQLEVFGKDLAKLEKENQKLHDAIAEFERKIAEAEDAIVNNIKSQDDKTFEIETQKQTIEDVKEKLNAIGKN